MTATTETRTSEEIRLSKKRYRKRKAISKKKRVQAEKAKKKAKRDARMTSEKELAFAEGSVDEDNPRKELNTKHVEKKMNSGEEVQPVTDEDVKSGDDACVVLNEEGPKKKKEKKSKRKSETKARSD